MQLAKNGNRRNVNIKDTQCFLKLFNKVHIHIHIGRSSDHRVKPNTFLDSHDIGDQADIIFMAQILIFEKSIIFHLHFRRQKFSFSYLKLAYLKLLCAQKQIQQRERRSRLN